MGPTYGRKTLTGLMASELQKIEWEKHWRQCAQNTIKLVNRKQNIVLIPFLIMPPISVTSNILIKMKKWYVWQLLCTCMHLSFLCIQSLVRLFVGNVWGNSCVCYRWIFWQSCRIHKHANKKLCLNLHPSVQVIAESKPLYIIIQWVN